MGDDGAARRLPLAGRYPAAVAMALLALCPFIVLSTATLLMQELLVQDLHTTRFGVGLAGALANAGYALGAVIAADLIKRVRKRHIYLVNEMAFTAASLLCAFAPGIATFTAGRTLEGVSTGMLLVVALPPLVTTYGAAKVPLTAAFINLGLFGMVTAGPLVGGAAAAESAWRALFVGMAVLGAAGVVVGLLAFDTPDDLDPRIGFDFSAIPVAAAATFLPFLGVAWLVRGGFGSAGFLVPLVLGLAALGMLLVRQYRKDEALMPLKLVSHTYPVTGIAAAMVAGAAFTALIELSATYLLLVRHAQPLPVGAALAGQIAGVAVAAWLFKRLLATRWLPAFTFCGLGLVVLGGLLVLFLAPGRALPLVVVGGVLLGFGAGAGVSPGLFMAGLSVPSRRLGPTFALVELLRAEAAFLVAPVLLAIAKAMTDLPEGVFDAALIAVVLCAVATLLLALLFAAGGVGLHPPDIEAWLGGEESAFESPPLVASLRDLG